MSVLETTSSITNAPNAVSNLNFSSDIKFDNVSFKYDKENVLSKVSFEVKKGQTLALVGQSGSGKSTIANLISRFYDVSDGAILIDGIDIRQITKSALRGNMGLVTQDSILFNETIKNNLLIGKENASDEDMIKALKIANAWEFIEKLPLGIETNIGDSGNKLSGGQKQRLSIARAVLKNPPIMILDEATSALDTESEQLVQVALENMMKNRTSIVIAHRLSTIKNADLILVLRNGRIVETGDHDSLMAHDGNYKKLTELQSFQ
jgi:ATP-binding cassette, subfamily B, bacterial MsbA